MGKITLAFANASCAHCARLVTRTLAAVDGVLSVDVDRIELQVVVQYDPSRVSADAIRAVMEGSGYSTRTVASFICAA